ncbi:MAG: DMT family transporter [Flavobacteriales bacterium]
MSFSILLAIFFPVCSVLLFKEFDKRSVHTLTAIVFNYLGAVILGLILFVTPSQLTSIHHQEWFESAFVVGGLFLFNFFLIAKTAINQGVSVATFANKISLVFPVVFTIVYFQESSSFWKIAGILLALLSVFLLTFKSNKSPKTFIGFYPLFIFIFTGIAETLINFTQKTWFSDSNEISYFVIAAFLISFILGVFLLVVKRVKITLKNCFAGFILSIPNTFGLYFFIQALNQNSDSSSVLPIMNIGTLLFAILIGFLLYKEQLTLRNWMGVASAILSILILSIF